tara:strand:- start:188 stop:1426 length:1239 start_codon:yes stop_codon:yes gene_type:complete
MSEFEQEKDKSETEKNNSENDKFSKIIIDFTKDVLNTFPEFADDLDEHLTNIITYTDDEELTSTNYLFNYCKSIYPEKFFDILYQNSELFDNEEPLYLLPGIDFNYIWSSDISDKTRETIWKYLQLLLFTLVSDIDDEKSFGDTAKLFEAINNDEFKTKLEDTIKDMHNIFNSSDISGNEGMNIPNADEMHEHITGMLDGKLGRLAREIAEETAGELDLDLSEDSNINDVYEKLFKNPSKLMGLVKNVGSKLDTKLKSGDIKESELMAEATELMKKMKDMPGMGNMQEMLGKMGLGGDGMNIKEMMKGMKGFDSKAMKGKAGQMNMNNFTAMMEKNMNDSKRREKILQDLEKKKQEKEAELKQQQELMKNYNAEEAEKNIRELLEMEDLDKKTAANSAEKPKKKKKKKKNKN